MSAGSQGWFHCHRMDPTCGSFQSQRSETTLEFRLLNSFKKKPLKNDSGWLENVECCSLHGL